MSLLNFIYNQIQLATVSNLFISKQPRKKKKNMIKSVHLKVSENINSCNLYIRNNCLNSCMYT